MKQIIQNLKNGKTSIVDVPVPPAGAGQILIRSTHTILSAGTERMLIDFGKAGWIDKARQQPEKVKQVLDKIKTDGILPTIEAVFNKLDEPISPGYCNAGVIVEVGAGVTEFQLGDRVVSNGPHAEIVCVPRNLCAKIPDGVSNEEAAFTVLASIALQGLRLSMPTLGERFMVFGLGLVGLLAVQFLRASGCPVLAVDVSQERLKLAESFGAKAVNLSKEADPVAAALNWTGGLGVDGVIVAASAKGDDIVHQAAESCRKRGRIILVGVVNLNLRRNDFYEKEISFQVSCSYGPGRYDEKYEQAGHDYPFGFVRWTEQRNFEAVLEALRSRQLHVKELITHRIALAEAAGMYDKVLHDPTSLGIIIEYPNNVSPDWSRSIQIFSASESPIAAKPVKSKHEVALKVGIIGSGNYAKATLLPALSRTKAHLVAIADINGVAAAHAARKYGASQAVSDYRLILNDPEIAAVFVLVGHHLHARFVAEVLASGKAVFVEKPLAIDQAQLNELILVYREVLYPAVMVGFNRRFSPHVIKIKEALAGRAVPLCMTMTVNAGFIPAEHWTQDPVRGGGRIIGEGCHFIDLLSYLAGARVTTVCAQMVGGKAPVREDKMSIVLGFGDGSIGTVHYLANGSKSYPKETLEVFGDARVIRMDNFRVTKGYGFKNFRSFRTWRQDKGHRAEIQAFINSVTQGGGSLISFDEIVNVTQASFAAVESAKTGKVITL